MKVNWLLVVGTALASASIAGFAIAIVSASGEGAMCSIVPSCYGNAPVFSSGMAVLSAISILSGIILIMVGYYGVGE